MKTKHCSWCDHQFDTTINYQIYCSAECRVAATKEKIAERYRIARRSKKSIKNRVCKSCGNALSVYNDDKICQVCTVNPSEVSKALKEIKGFLNDD